MKYILLSLAAVAIAVNALLPVQQTAQAICDQYHHNPSANGEQLCSEALEREQSIYICNKDGNICRTERLQ